MTLRAAGSGIDALGVNKEERRKHVEGNTEGWGRVLLVQRVAAHPAYDPGCHEQYDPDDRQPDKALDHESQDGEDDPNDKENNY